MSNDGTAQSERSAEVEPQEGFGLILTRKLYESIRVGDGPNAIRITVVRIGRDAVRIAVKAPAHVKIMRTELGETLYDDECSNGEPPHVRTG
jgi:carbon storage regulator CsrA